MSRNSSSGPIPTVVLVTPHANTPRRRRSHGDGEVPWMKIAIGATVAFMAVIGVMALYLFRQSDRQRIDLGGVPAAPAIRLDAAPIAPKPVAADKQQEPVEEPAAVQPPAKDDFVDCQQIGTDVRFMKDPTAAFKRARAEKKMVYVMHLSGNLDDPEFT